MNPELLTQTGFSRTEPAVTNSGIHRFVTLFPALLTALFLYAGNMRRMLIENLIHAEFFIVYRETRASERNTVGGVPGTGWRL